jgi:hypothetical protein
MEDLLAMVGLGESAGVGQDAEEFLHTLRQQQPRSSIPSPAPAPAPTPGPSATKPSGEQFMVWLKQGIASRRLIINDAKALVHTVNDTAYLVSPGVFQRYAQEHPEVAALAKQENQQDWQWVQKRFEKLQLTSKVFLQWLNIWTCEVTVRGSPADCMATSSKMGPALAEIPNPLSCSDSGRMTRFGH